MVPKAILRWMTAAGFPLAILGQTAPQTAPAPRDAYELVTAPVELAGTLETRQAALQLLGRARGVYDLRKIGRAYDLKVSFTVNSAGQTLYDGAWQMEDIFDPQQGLHWTASAAAGFSVTQVRSASGVYRQGTSNVIPLRLQEARAALFDPMPAFNREGPTSIRTSVATFNGRQVSCVLYSGSAQTATAPGRDWEETEDCVDPKTGRLVAHSQVPGRYFVYDYSKTFSLGDRVLPGKTLVTEGGRVVSEIFVESLTEVPYADPELFVPTAEMKSNGPAPAMAGAQKIWGPVGQRKLPAGAAVRTVCVFGLATPSGHLVEAHSLQPSDPNSQAAVEAAKRMKFAKPARPGARPQQHFVFIIEKFPVSE